MHISKSTLTDAERERQREKYTEYEQRNKCDDGYRGVYAQPSLYETEILALGIIADLAQRRYSLRHVVEGSGDGLQNLFDDLVSSLEARLQRCDVGELVMLALGMPDAETKGE